MTEDVLIIGAGPAGIATAYYLQQAGIRYRVVDQADEIGSTWNSLYPSLKLNTSRFFSHLPGKPFPLRYGLFATAKQYHRYLVEFVAEHKLKIDLGVAVEQIKPAGDGWQVTTTEGSDWYPAVVSATGRFNNPYLPNIPGMDRFNGQILHTQDYLGPQDFAGQRVMVVGNGPSGVDIATELGNAPDVMHPVLLAQRTGVMLRPRYPLGLPKHLWVIISEKLPAPLGDRLMAYVNSRKFENLDKIGIKAPRTAEESSAAGGTRGHELIDVVQARRVRSVDGPTCFRPDCVELQDGSCVRVDSVIMGTGYLPVIDRYFHEPVERDNQGWPLRVGGDRDRQDTGGRQIVGYPGLYLVGVFYTGKGAMYNFNVEARQALAEIQAHLAHIQPEPAPAD
jgi:putative flavoprotein involved in K+ transport